MWVYKRRCGLRVCARNPADNKGMISIAEGPFGRWIEWAREAHPLATQGYHGEWPL